MSLRPATNDDLHARTEALMRRGMQSHGAGRLAEAEAAYREILADQPLHAGALHLLGLIAVQLGQAERAVALFDRAIGVRRDFAEAHADRGTALFALNRLEEALASYDAALALKPGHAGAQGNRANVLQTLGRLDEAVAGYDRALKLDPRVAAAHFGRGATLNRLGRFEEALASHDAALALDPGYAKAWQGRGLASVALGRLDDAVASFERAVALAPDFAGAHANLSDALMRLGRPAEALASQERVVALLPNDAEAHAGRANILSDLGRYEEAIAGYRQALALRPDLAKAHLHLAMCLLRLGRFEEGWREYEWRAPLDERLSRRAYAEPVWTGQDCAGQTVFLYAEQGLGDTIQFCRYAAMLAERGAEVVLAAPETLHGLLATLRPTVRTIGEGEAPERFDVHAPLLSLPRAFGTDLDSIPALDRYLEADDRWSGALESAGKRRIGVVWSGSRTHRNDANRSVPFALFQAILHDGVDWISLQTEVRPEDADAFKSSEIRDFGGKLHSLTDTAALVEQLDLVITVDTSVAHLAGALGKPVWILLPFNADWRWLRGRTDSPWYPSARLYRQPAIGAWEPVLAAVRTDLSL